MAQETKPVASKEKHCGHQRTDDITAADDDIEEIEIPPKPSLNDKITRVMEKFASTSLGQFMVERTDRVLKVIEDTAKWSLPQDKDIPLERPLPWIFFIALIIWLRVVRIGLSGAYMMVGSGRVTPESMVYYVQVKRRRLRAIRVSALKSIRSRQNESSAMCSGSSGKQVTLIGKLRTLFGSAMCKPGQHREVPSRRVFVSSDKDQASKDKPERSSKRPRDDDNADHNLTVDEMLDKYADEPSDADSDYVPKEDEDDDSASTSCSSTSSDETEKENNENSKETAENSEKSSSSKNDSTLMDQSIVEIKENGGTQTHHRPMPKPLIDIKLEPLSDVDSGSEQVQTPKENRESGQNTEGEMAAATEVATQQKSLSSRTTNTTNAPSHHQPAAPQNQQQESMNTPIQSRTQLSVPEVKEDQQKSTPGHMSAASLKPIITTTASAGSPQDFHSIFHPAPIVKVPAVAAHSTPKEDEDSANSSAETSDFATGNPKKPMNNLNHNKQNQYHNAKNRNKNRR